MGGGLGGEAGGPGLAAANLVEAVEAALRLASGEPVLTMEEAGAGFEVEVEVDVEEPVLSPTTLLLRGSHYPFAVAEAWRALRAVPENAVLSVVAAGDAALDGILDVCRELDRRVTAVELGAQRWSISIQPGRLA